MGDTIREQLVRLGLASQAKATPRQAPGSLTSELDAAQTADEAAALLTRAAEAGAEYDDRTAAAVACRWAWALHLDEDDTRCQRPARAPHPGELDDTPTRRLVWGWCPDLDAELARRYPCSEGHVVVFHPEPRPGWYHDGPHCWAPGSRPTTVVGAAARALKLGAYPTTPSPAGWFRRDGHGRWNWHGPDAYQALVAATSWRGGCCAIDASVLEAYARHPERNFPGLVVCAWKHRQVVPVPDHIGRHFDALKILVADGLADRIPAEAWTIPVAPGRTQAGKPRLSDAPRGAARARLVLLVEGESGRGWRGHSGDCDRACPADDAEGAGRGVTVLAAPYGTSNGGGQRVQACLAYIPEASTLRLRSGAGIDWTGARIPGAGQKGDEE